MYIVAQFMFNFDPVMKCVSLQESGKKGPSSDTYLQEWTHKIVR